LFTALRQIARLFRLNRKPVGDGACLPSLGAMRAARAMSTRRRSIDKQSAAAARGLELAMQQSADTTAEPLTSSRERS
jgi:hypothetical protein